LLSNGDGVLQGGEPEFWNTLDIRTLLVVNFSQLGSILLFVVLLIRILSLTGLDISVGGFR
jgi:hypothetical protein